jgi:hypothetical protein
LVESLAGSVVCSLSSSLVCYSGAATADAMTSTATLTPIELFDILATRTSRAPRSHRTAITQPQPEPRPVTRELVPRPGVETVACDNTVRARRFLGAAFSKPVRPQRPRDHTTRLLRATVPQPIPPPVPRTAVPTAVAPVLVRSHSRIAQCPPKSARQCASEGRPASGSRARPGRVGVRSYSTRTGDELPCLRLDLPHKRSLRAMTRSLGIPPEVCRALLFTVLTGLWQLEG